MFTISRTKKQWSLFMLSIYWWNMVCKWHNHIIASLFVCVWLNCLSPRCKLNHPHFLFKDFPLSLFLQLRSPFWHPSLFYRVFNISPIWPFLGKLQLLLTERVYIKLKIFIEKCSEKKVLYNKDVYVRKIIVKTKERYMWGILLLSLQVM